MSAVSARGALETRGAGGDWLVRFSSEVVEVGRETGERRARARGGSVVLRGFNVK